MNRPSALALLAAAGIVAGCQIETGTASGDLAPDTLAARVVTPPQRDLADTLAVAVPADPGVLPARPTAATDRDAAADALLDLVDRAPNADGRTLARVTGATEAQLGALRSPPPALDSLRRVTRSAAQRGDRAAVAVSAARAYQLLAASRPDGDPSRLRGDALVVSALAAAPLPDWRALQAGAAELSERWSEVRSRVSDTGVRDAMTRAVDGVASGVGGQDVAAVRLGAGVVVDLAGSLP